MVQLFPNLSLTLKALGHVGCTVSAEQQAALDHSLPIKRAEAGLKVLVLWGKITTLNGKDYLIAEGFNDPVLELKAVNFQAKYYYSQDGVKWNDLQAISLETDSRAARINGVLSGDPTKPYDVEEADPNAVPPPPPEEGAEGGEPPEEPKPLVFRILELEVLRCRIDAINAATGVIPTGSMLTDAHNRIVVNKLYSGAPFPDKLECYSHRTVPPGGDTLAQDLRGSWSIQYDPFKGVATVRSLLFPGYFFYYSSYENTWGSMYTGDGTRNDDLVFML